MRAQAADTDPKAEKVQLDLLRAATVARRTALAFSLSETVIGMARRAIRRQSPDLTDQDLLLRFVEIHYGPELAERLRENLLERSE